MLQNIRKGFTLIELLIVIAIIGVLAGAVVISLGDETDKATNATVKLNVRSVATQALVLAINEDHSTDGDNDFCDKLKTTNAKVKRVTHADGLNVSGSGNNKLGDAGEIGCVSHDEEWVIIGRGEGADAFEDPAGNNAAYWCVDHEGYNSGTDVTPAGIVTNAAACT